MRSIFFLSFLTFFLYACTTDREDNSKSIFYDDMRKCIHLVELFEKADYEIIPLRIDSSALPAVGMKFFAYQDYLLIGDNQYTHTIFLYNNQGEFLHTIGSKGEAPHEYSALIDFSVHHDTVSIADIGGSGDCFLHYDLNGNFFGKTKLPNRIVSFAKDSEGKYIINSGRNAYQGNWQITHYTKDLKVIGQYWELNKDENNIPVFEQNFSCSDNEVFFHEAFNNQLYKLANNRFEPSYQLIFDSTNDFSRIRTGNFMTEVDALYKKGFYLLNGYLESESDIFLSLDYIKDSKTEKQVLGVYNKKLREGNIFEMPPSSIFMGNLRNNILYLMTSDYFINEQFPDIEKTEDTDIYVLKVML